MISIEFDDIALYEIYTKGKTSDRRYKKLCKDARLISNIQYTIMQLSTYDNLTELRHLRNSPLHYERLRHDYSGKSSVRLLREHQHKSLRLIFTENDETITINLLELTDHYASI